MTLPAGSRVGPYTVLGPLGAGGMGEVYRFIVARGPESLSEPLRLVAVPDWFDEMKARLAGASR